MRDTAESWEWVPDYEGKYAVSDFGRVYSHVSKKFLKPGPRASGHVSVALHDGTGKGRSVDVHLLVLSAFKGRKPEWAQDARHLNGQPDDNRLSNLEWATRRRNKQDQKYHNGARGHKLKPEDVAAIRSAIADGHSYRTIAKRYGISFGMVGHIKAGISHADV